MVNQKTKDGPDPRDRETYKRQKVSETEEAKSKATADTKPADEPWLYKGIIVKIMQKSLGGGKFYKQKGRVYKVVSQDGGKAEVEWGYQGNVKMLTGSAKDMKVSIDQINLEPSIPVLNPEGSKPEVLILKGKYKGKTGIITELDLNEQFGIVKVDTDDHEMLRLEFDCFTECALKKK